MGRCGIRFFGTSSFEFVWSLEMYAGNRCALSAWVSGGASLREWKSAGFWPERLNNGVRDCKASTFLQLTSALQSRASFC